MIGLHMEKEQVFKDTHSLILRWLMERDEINARELYLLLEGIEVVRERRRYTRLPINV